MMEIVCLSESFYDDYVTCLEIEKKQSRPHAMTLVTVDNLDFAIPFRSNIGHKYVIWTDKQNKCGLDLSKALVIGDKENYIDKIHKPQIRQNEFNSLKGKDKYIKLKLEKYIEKYKKAIENEIEGKKDKENLVKYSTLQYFHRELKIEDKVEISN